MAITLNQTIIQRSAQKQAEPLTIERINDGKDYVILYINPQRINIRQKKVMQQVQTNTGWIFQHWGYEPFIISYNGVTGYMNPSTVTESVADLRIDYYWREAGVQQQALISPYKTPAYQALLKLRDFYETPQKQMQGMDLTKITKDTDDNFKRLALRLYYRADTYEGYLTKFELSEEEMSPWMWSYTMEFTAYDSNYANQGSSTNVMNEIRNLKQYYNSVNTGTDADLIKAIYDLGSLMHH